MKGCECTSVSQIDEPEVVIGESAIVVIQPVISEQRRCGIERFDCRAVGHPTSEVPVLDV